MFMWLVVRWNLYMIQIIWLPYDVAVSTTPGNDRPRFTATEELAGALNSLNIKFDPWVNIHTIKSEDFTLIGRENVNNIEYTNETP